MKKSIMSSVSITALLYAGDNSPKWKTDDDGNVVLNDGNPVYVDAQGREMIVDQSTIGRLNNEAKQHREAKQAAEEALKKFEGIDPEKARNALDKIEKIDQKDLIESGQVEKLKNEITSQFTEQMNEKDNKIEELQGSLAKLHIESVFKGSEFVRDNISVPIDMFEATFSKNFKYEDGEVAAYDSSGNRLMSRKKVGELASPDEALELLVEAHPHKDTILKADAGSGSGSDGKGGFRGGSSKMSRNEFDKLSPVEQAGIAAKVREGEIVLTE